MLANAEGKAEVRTVVANTLLHGQWLVESGLKDGERVIIGGTQKLVPGAAVKVLPEAATTAPAAALAQK